MIDKEKEFAKKIEQSFDKLNSIIAELSHSNRMNQLYINLLDRRINELEERFKPEKECNIDYINHCIDSVKEFVCNEMDAIKEYLSK